MTSQTAYCVSGNNDHHLYATAQYWNLVGASNQAVAPGITRPLHATALTTRLRSPFCWCHELSFIYGQSWIQFELQNSPNRAFATVGKIDTTTFLISQSYWSHKWNKGVKASVPKFLGILLGFSTNESFGGCACTASSYTTVRMYISVC